MIAVPPDELTHDQIRQWLDRALRGQESLPHLTNDEPSYLAILRLEKSLRPATRDSLREGCRQLLSQFCLRGEGETEYLHQLLGLATTFNNWENAQMLAELAYRFPGLTEPSHEIRLSVLSALVDMSPPQTLEFWDRVRQQEPEHYGLLALSGTLATHPEEAVEILPQLPDDPHTGGAAALILELTWDDLPPDRRFRFARAVRTILGRCGSNVAAPVRAWADSVDPPANGSINSSLCDGIEQILQSGCQPKTWTPALVPSSAA